MNKYEEDAVGMIADELGSAPSVVAIDSRPEIRMLVSECALRLELQETSEKMLIINGCELDDHLSCDTCKELRDILNKAKFK